MRRKCFHLANANLCFQRADGCIDYDLVVSERDQRINSCGSDSWKQDSERGRNSERGDRAKIGVEIPWADTEKKLFEKSRNGYCASESDRKSDRDQPQSLDDDETDDVDGFGAQSS